MNSSKWAIPTTSIPPRSSTAAQRCQFSKTTQSSPALVEDGDRIHIDIPHRTIEVLADEPTLTARREALGGVYAAKHRDRKVSTALRAYAAMASSADQSAVRDVTRLN